MIRKIAWLLVCFSVLCMPSLCQKVSHEESLVREAYAKVTYMMQLHVVGQAALESYRGDVVDRVRFNNDLNMAKAIFQLDSFHVGDYAEVANKKAAEIITLPLPPAKILIFSLGSQSFSENNGQRIEWPEAIADWQNAKNQPVEIIDALSNLTVQEALSLNHEGPYDRYVRFEVRITYLDHVEGPYRAFFMFGKNADGKETISPYDRFVGANTLAKALVEPMDPSVFLKTHLRDMPPLSDWLSSTEILDSKCVRGRVCCSGSHCGIGHAELQRWSRIPLSGQSAAVKVGRDEN